MSWVHAKSVMKSTTYSIYALLLVQHWDFKQKVLYRDCLFRYALLCWDSLHRLCKIFIPFFFTLPLAYIYTCTYIHVSTHTHTHTHLYIHLLSTEIAVCEQRAVKAKLPCWGQMPTASVKVSQRKAIIKVLWHLLCFSGDLLTLQRSFSSLPMGAPRY